MGHCSTNSHDTPRTAWRTQHRTAPTTHSVKCWESMLVFMLHSKHSRPPPTTILQLSSKFEHSCPIPPSHHFTVFVQVRALARVRQGFPGVFEASDIILFCAGRQRQAERQFRLQFCAGKQRGFFILLSPLLCRRAEACP